MAVPEMTSARWLIQISVRKRVLLLVEDLQKKRRAKKQKTISGVLVQLPENFFWENGGAATQTLAPNNAKDTKSIRHEVIHDLTLARRT
jgi:hypothetical protein